MTGLLSGLASLGLDKLENMSIYEQPEKDEQKQQAKEVKVAEKDLVYDKTAECPVCGENFTVK